MSEQKHMDTVEQARKLLSDGDENYKLHTVIWLYQQSEKVADFTKEKEELRNKVIEEIIQEIFGIAMPNDVEYQIIQKLIAIKK